MIPVRGEISVRSNKDPGTAKLLTASVIGNEITVFVEVMHGIQALIFRMDVVEVLAVEDDTAQSSASG